MSIILPKNWSQAKLGELNCFKSITLNPALFDHEKFELYSVPSYPSNSPELINGSEIGSTKQIVDPNDVLICKINPRINRVWKVRPRSKSRQIASSEWIVMRSPRLHPDYLRYYFLNPSFREMICTDVTGVGGSLTRAQPKRVAEFPIPIAPLNEQRRIVDKLDTLLARTDACRERLKRVSVILKRFRQVVIDIAMSGELTEDWRANHPPQWRKVRLAEIADIQGGITKDSKKQSLDYEEVPYLRVANVQRGFLDLSEVRTIRIPREKIGALLLQPGDILFNEGGDLDKLGRGWVWEGQIEQCSFQNHVFRARLLNPANHPKYVSWWGNSRGLDYFLQHGKQTTNLASINKTMLGNLPIDLPPAEEQHEIVRRVETLFVYADALEARYHAAHTQVERLTPAILSKAFRGELVPQDSNDEPASTLLERIRAERATVAKQSTKRTPTTTMSKSTSKKNPASPVAIVDAIREAEDEISGRELLIAAGYASDAGPEEVETFLVAIREALEKKQIVRERRHDEDWFSLAKH